MGKKKKKKLEEVVSEEQNNTEVNIDELQTEAQNNIETNIEENPKKKKKKKKKKEKTNDIEESISFNDNSNNNENPIDFSTNDEIKFEENQTDISENNINTTNEDLYAPFGDKTFNKEQNNNEDLYAPFGDKTFNKDELLSSNTTNEVQDNSNVEFNDIDINRIKNDNEYLEHLDENIIKENLKQRKTPEEQNEFNFQMIKNYMGENYKLFINDKFNIYAFLLGAFYLMYRKIYLYGISLYLLGLILITFFININNYIGLVIVLLVLIVIHVISAKRFNKMYLDKSYTQIKKIEDMYNANRDEYVLSKCKELGGTDIIKMIIISLALGLIVVFSVIQISNFMK